MTASASARVLIVDDEPDICNALSRTVRVLAPRVPLEVLVATDPAAGLALAREVPPSSPLLVLSDFNMGAATDGLQLLEEIARVRPDAQLVLWSGYPKTDFEERPEYARVHAFLPKPFDLGELRALLSRFALEKAQ